MTETEKNGLEIERKFLIRMPAVADLLREDGVRVWHIEQTYLTAPQGLSRRVRAIGEGDTVRYIYTEKRRVSAAVAHEYEHALTKEAYDALLRERDEARKTVKKTRYVIPCRDGHVAEVDIYAFWDDRATVEVELAAEDETFVLPACLSVVREITADKRYKNAALARELPDDPL